MKKLIFLGPDEYEKFVQNRLSDFYVVKAQSVQEVEDHIQSAEVIFDAYMKVPFTKELLSKAKNLKLFITATTGASHIDTNFLESLSVPLLTLKGQEHITGGLTAAAEHSWLLLMAVARQLPAALLEIHDGGWDRNKFPGVMLKGKTIGIIGCGRIGQWMARYANAFGMRVLGYDEHKTPDSELFESTELNHLLTISDFITIHIPFNEDTRDFLNKARFTLIKRGAVFVNTSRGEVINEEALLSALQTGQIAGAGLDVLQSEPNIIQDPLVEYALQNKNLIITPHIGGLSPDALDIVLDFTCTRIKNFFND
jgi:D-3-phosphoglycerate dehydrogenase